METIYIKIYRTIPLLKENVWVRIKNYAKEEQFNNLLQSFEKDFYKLISQAKVSMRNKRNEELRTCLHTLKGIAGTVGANRLHQMAKGAERLDIDTLNKNHFIEEIEKCAEDSLREMKN
ncbi:Hpt domain-containing protein [Flammeovirga sp. MY04]|uniref:Hpt domain-containing protein n=1 Tax=Flammeovirga sp. MY04 TaxID=1191459 RepID=UPI0008263A13|nr:Hpt domain-containing protein [Flammeovirga sp. MY04]QJD09424.1 Hpt domain-containing protein [Flammeovirga sp. MY04]